MNRQIDESSFAYIFERDNSFRVHGHSEAKKLWDSIINEGYKHVSTVDWAVYLQWLLNDCTDIDAEKKSLVKTKLNATNEPTN